MARKVSEIFADIKLHIEEAMLAEIDVSEHVSESLVQHLAAAHSELETHIDQLRSIEAAETGPDDPEPVEGEDSGPASD